MTYLVSLTIGHNTQDLDVTLTTQDIIDAITQIIDFPYTIIPCQGIWDGVPEDSSRVEFDLLTPEQRDDILLNVRCLANTLDQTAILVNVRESSSYLVYSA